MKSLARLLTTLLASLPSMLLALNWGATSVRADDEPGYVSIFDGKTLDGWDGNPDFWSVEDGAITGRTTAEKTLKQNTFLIWRKGELADFELKAEFKIENGNSGIQYRSFELPNVPWGIGGYQADIDKKPEGGYIGIVYGEKFRGILCQRGQKTVIGADHKPKEAGTVGDSREIFSKVKPDDWNEYHITGKGFTFTQRINGVVTAECTDEDTEQRRASGLLALQLHVGPPMKIQFRNIRVKHLTTTAARPTGQFNVNVVDNNEPKKVVFVAGKQSHGYAQHEHNAGCDLLARELKRALPSWKAQVYHSGWPTEANPFDGADAIVMYSDGGAGHMVNTHLDEVDALARQGVGIVCIHYAVEVPKDSPSATRFLDWIGGYFEPHWSVNPHWTASYDKFPDHPVTRGVKPFSINDEWYYHMRFRPNMDRVTPILSALPPASSLSRPDGPHSGNPAVREEVAKGVPQVMAWAAERAGGGRGFGFTGGHNHWNWGDPNFRKVVLNAIVWTAHGIVPDNGVELKPVTLEDLEANQDKKKIPDNFDREAIRKQLNLPADGQKQTSAAPAGPARAAAALAVKPLFQSSLVTTSTPGHMIDLSVPLNGAKELYLVVTDGASGIACDWADWVEPRLVGPKGELKLTDLKWKSASSDFGTVNVNKNCSGGPLQVAGKSIAYGIGTHANSVIAFDLPEGYDRFVAQAGIDNGGSAQGAAADVQFLVFDGRPSPAAIRASQTPASSHDPQDAIAGIDIAPGIEATLFASEPMVLNLTNLDIDDRGRIWVCEVMNYRKHNGTRADGDRILILEDVDHDGRADKSTVYYQGRDVDSAMGICVLGNKLIVSCSPNVWVFTDDNGDDKPDRKELLFSNVGQPQHDHSAHTFLFGPDGKYYWNFGNTGQKVCDAKGNPVVDTLGRQVVDNGKPYYGGMAFRCNPDGSQFEVLAHNFRNNYEVTVDSFGTLWQSDNDDDGNRSVRINFLMEHGNFGYRDQATGAGWNTPRENLETDIPERHWHQNDPGVVPNLLVTGGGSPTGICVYEGRLLPKTFWDQVIHCDAGPSVVRAYVTTPHGAGYRAEVVNLMEGTRDRWFRPADVCVAPDGSLFVTDWYDPGVGGHAQGDLDRGRIFRLAPLGHKYNVPKFDYASVGGAIEAFKSPALSVRYKAFVALQKMGPGVKDPLFKVFEETNNARLRARLVWLMGKLPDCGEFAVAVASRDKDPNVRITGLRLARQLQLDNADLLSHFAADESPAVRREVAIALHHSTAPGAAHVWADLATRYDGHDRWYLEALGIGADGRWDDYLPIWLAKIGGAPNSPAARDIVWRSRSTQTPALIAAILKDPATSSAEQPRLFRALDMLSGPEKEQAIVSLLEIGSASSSETADSRVVKALLRVGNVDLSQRQDLKQIVTRYLAQQPEPEIALRLIEKTNLREARDMVGELLAAPIDDSLRMRAGQIVVRWKDLELLEKLVADKDPLVGARAIQAVGLSGAQQSNPWFETMLLDGSRNVAQRTALVEALGRNLAGQKSLLKTVEQGAVPAELKFSYANALLGSNNQEIRAAAGKHLQLPAGLNQAPLPPVSEMVRKKGNKDAGRQIYLTTGTCAKCHKVSGEGKDVGPDLSEIGTKLSREAMYVSILDPSAAISHNYENYALVLEDGTALNGVLVSQTDDEVVIKTAEAIVRNIPRKQIDAMEKSKISLMPGDLQKNLTAQNLIDLIEYLSTLKKK